ncbi:MAG: putative PEP-binding protein, partial [Gammaproteobacteria bacterium]
VSPGAVSGLVYFDSKSAIEAKLQAGSAGTSRPELPASGASPPSPGVILVKRYTSSDDVDALEVVDGIITLRSGFATHSMVIARSWNKPFVAGVGKDIDVASGLLTLDDPTAGAEGGEIHISEGECITFDGSTGYVYSGNLLVSRGMPEVGPVEARERLLAWADEIRRSTPLRVRANVDTAAEAREAFAPANGATGIGMCRTEVLVEKMGRQDLLATLVSAKEGSIEERTALLELERLLTAELADLYHEAGRVPVAVRLLDRLDPGRHDGVDRAMPEESGVRGVRLAFMRPAVYQTQLRAIVAAATEGGRGNEPSLEVIVPFVIDPAEVRYVRGLLERTVNDIRVARGPDILRDFVPSLGAMLETPRAVMLSHLFAGECDFLSYGLNDLSDLVFGISSHDEELLHRYRDYGFLDVDPVTSIDRASVGLLVQRSIYAARSTKPHLEIGVAAVHARDRDSVAFLFDPPHPKGAEVPLSINYVSVAPEDLQIARLVTAQAVIAAEFGEEAGGPPRLDVTGPPGRP